MTFGSKGVQTVSYAGTILEDIGANPNDAFHIWHMQATDLRGNVLSTSGTTWGETNAGESWNAATNTETYNFSWGSIAVRFAAQGNNLDMQVTETNNAGSGVIFDGAEIYPFSLHFPKDPTGFNGYSQILLTTNEPAVSAADFGTGLVTSVIPDESVTLYGGWKSQGSSAYSPVMTSTLPDNLAPFVPVANQPLTPGNQLSYTVSLRFTPEGTSASAADAYSSFASTYPSQMSWTDKRIIGTAYLASSPASTGDVTQPGGFPTNPRRYFDDPSINIQTTAGLESFQDRILGVAAANVTNAQALGAQGIITWDVEGEQYPQNTTYACSPDQISTVAPEMESTILDSSSPYFGRRLDDAYFATMTDAGFKVGVCLRPQVFTFGSNGTASQRFLSGNASIAANLEKKAKFANTRWGATLFYVDSSVDTNGTPLDPAIFEQLITDLPGFLFIPEESTPRYYAYSAPFYSFIFHNTVGTDPVIYGYYPKAFGATLINDAAPSSLSASQTQLTQAVAHGDILMGFADYWQANDPTLVAIYKAAGGSSSPSTTVPVIRWPTPSPVTYGTPLSGAQLNATASTPGTFGYTPAAGTVLGAGSQTLFATFSPNDTADFKSATASVNLQVKAAAPLISWALPAAISAGTPLSAQQLNATANVPGSFSYSPAAGTVLAAGQTTLSTLFTPSDPTDFVNQTASVSLTVTSASQGSASLAILSPASGATVSGAIVVTGQCSLALDAAGSYLEVDGVEVGTHRVTGAPYSYPLDTTTLTNGAHSLQLWGHDIGNHTVVSQAVQLFVAN